VCCQFRCVIGFSLFSDLFSLPFVPRESFAPRFTRHESPSFSCQSRASRLSSTTSIERLAKKLPKFPKLLRLARFLEFDALFFPSHRRNRVHTVRPTTIAGTTRRVAEPLEVRRFPTCVNLLPFTTHFGYAPRDTGCTRPVDHRDKLPPSSRRSLRSLNFQTSSNSAVTSSRLLELTTHRQSCYEVERFGTSD